MFITSSPSVSPSISPVTGLPTEAPSFLGLVVSVEISKSTTSALDEDEIRELQNIVAQAYGVSPDDIVSVTEYVTTGTISVEIPDSLTEDEALAALTAAMSTALGVSEESIELSIDAETGEVTYSVATGDYDESAAVLAALQDSNVADQLATDSGIGITSVSPNPDVVAEVTAVVNADEVTVPLQQAENIVESLLGDEYVSDSKGMKCLF